MPSPPACPSLPGYAREARHRIERHRGRPPEWHSRSTRAPRATGAPTRRRTCSFLASCGPRGQPCEPTPRSAAPEKLAQRRPRMHGRDAPRRQRHVRRVDEQSWVNDALARLRPRRGRLTARARARSGSADAPSAGPSDAAEDGTRRRVLASRRGSDACADSRARTDRAQPVGWTACAHHPKKMISFFFPKNAQKKI